MSLRSSLTRRGFIQSAVGASFAIKGQSHCWLLPVAGTNFMLSQISDRFT